MGGVCCCCVANSRARERYIEAWRSLELGTVVIEAQAMDGCRSVGLDNWVGLRA